jgi:hypothetical protein
VLIFPHTSRGDGNPLYKNVGNVENFNFSLGRFDWGPAE